MAGDLWLRRAGFYAKEMESLEKIIENFGKLEDPASCPGSSNDVYGKVLR